MKAGRLSCESAHRPGDLGAGVLEGGQGDAGRNSGPFPGKGSGSDPESLPGAQHQVPGQQHGHEGAEACVQRDNSGLDTCEDSGPHTPHAALETRRGWGLGLQISRMLFPANLSSWKQRQTRRAPASCFSGALSRGAGVVPLPAPQIVSKTTEEDEVRGGGQRQSVRAGGQAWQPRAGRGGPVPTVIRF